MIARAARAALRDRAVQNADISITILDDAEIAEMNREFLAHDNATDVISFALYEYGEPPVGDIYIGFDEAVRQAAANGVPIDEELARLAIHGVLHVLGYEHPENGDREKSEMWRIQESIVAKVIA